MPFNGFARMDDRACTQNDVKGQKLLKVIKRQDVVESHHLSFNELA